jgi:hypothetical protein
MSPLLTHRDILQRHAISVAFGAKRTSVGKAGPVMRVANDPKRTLSAYPTLSTRAA